MSLRLLGIDRILDARGGLNLNGTFVIFLSRIIGYVVDRVVFKTERQHGPGFLIIEERIAALRAAS